MLECLQNLRLNYFLWRANVTTTFNLISLVLHTSSLKKNLVKKVFYFQKSFQYLAFILINRLGIYRYVSLGGINLFVLVLLYYYLFWMVNATLEPSFVMTWTTLIQYKVPYQTLLHILRFRCISVVFRGYKKSGNICNQIVWIEWKDIAKNSSESYWILWIPE